MEDRLKTLLYNAISILYDSTIENYNSDDIWWQDICIELGTTQEELASLGINVNEFTK